MDKNAQNVEEWTSEPKIKLFLNLKFRDDSEFYQLLPEV